MGVRSVNDVQADSRLDNPVARVIAAGLAAALTLSLSGAFDTEEAALGPRSLYWLAIAALSLAALEGAHCLLSRRAPGVDRLLLRLAGWAILLLPLTSLAVLSCKLLFGGSPTLAGFRLLLPGMASILAALQFVLATLRPGPAPAGPIDRPDMRGDALREGLPLPLRGFPILALQAQDHYVRVHTPAGNGLVRMRLRDAIDLVGGEGVRPHRSWWVACSAIAALQREADRNVLMLVTGERVPISRAARRQLGPNFAAAG